MMSDLTNKFLVFAGEFYYPAGGWKDFRGSFDTYEEAYKHATSLNRFEPREGDDPNDPYYKMDWWHIVVNGAVVEGFYKK